MLLLCCGMMLFGCADDNGRRKAEQQKTIVVTDSVGRKVELPYPLERVAVCNVYNAELITAVGAIDKIVGVDNYIFKDQSGFKNRFNEAQVFGISQNAMNYEKLAELAPQAVIITGEGTWRDAQEMLDRFGIKVIVINSYYTDQFADNCTLNWSDTEKERISKAMKSLDAEIKKQSYNLDFPKEIIFVKTTQKEEGNAEAYTRVNWIAIGEYALKEASDADLKYLVAHELFHLLTRQNSNFKKDIYKVIGFTVIEKEIIFPSDLAEIRISNPDISRYDSYGTFTIGGQKQYCTMVIYTDRPYDGKTLFDYLKVGLVPLNGDFVPIQKAGKTIIYALDEAEDFYTQVGKNTNYLIHPEEIMADNFAFTLIGKKDLANPEIIQNVQKVLKAKNR